MRKGVWQDRDDLARHGVNIWRDATAFYQTSDQVNSILEKRIYTARKFTRLPRYQREYVRGFIDSYRVNVVDRMSIESGQWVTMPDKTVRYFGTADRVQLKEDIGGIGPYRYIHENSIPDRAGLFWKDKEHGWNGAHPFFIPAIDFDPWWKDGHFDHEAKQAHLTEIHATGVSNA